MGEAKRVREYFENNPNVIRPAKEIELEREEEEVVVTIPPSPTPKRPTKFTTDLLEEFQQKNSPSKPRKVMSKEELKIWKNRRNQRRHQNQKAVKLAKTVGHNLANKESVNSCRRQRLARKHKGL